MRKSSWITAVRLSFPKEFQFRTPEMFIRKEGSEVVCLLDHLTGLPISLKGLSPLRERLKITGAGA
jgi:hypothetical protein